MSSTNLTRRSFMKASALAAGAAALGSGVATVSNLVESDKAYAADEVKLVHTSCRACISNCVLWAGPCGLGLVKPWPGSAPRLRW